MSFPKAAVIIPTRGRIDCLKQTLKDLSTQDTDDFDIWVVDQNDEPLKGLHECVKDRFLHHELMQPLGSHAGRNHAIFKTQSPICIFVDDDVRINSDFVRRHLEAHENFDVNLGAIAGRVVQPKDGYSEEQMKSMGQPAKYNSWIGKVSGNFVGSKSTLVEHIHECNFSAKTKWLKRIGGFNEEFRGNAYFEGADLALRLIKSGHNVIYNPEISLIHLQDGKGGNRVSQKSKHTYWFMRNYGLLNSLHMKKIGVPGYVLFGAGYVFSKALKNMDPEIAKQGVRGFVDGLSYFLPGRVRLRTRS